MTFFCDRCDQECCGSPIECQGVFRQICAQCLAETAEAARQQRERERASLMGIACPWHKVAGNA